MSGRSLTVAGTEVRILRPGTSPQGTALAVATSVRPGPSTARQKRALVLGSTPPGCQIGKPAWRQRERHSFEVQSRFFYLFFNFLFLIFNLQFSYIFFFIFLYFYFFWRAGGRRGLGRVVGAEEVELPENFKCRLQDARRLESCQCNGFPCFFVPPGKCDGCF
ncbi:hypothetical protein VUR80DRAFT_9585 [Thermomyces stellatus]